MIIGEKGASGTMHSHNPEPRSLVGILADKTSGKVFVEKRSGYEISPSKLPGVLACFSYLGPGLSVASEYVLRMSLSGR